MRNEIWLEYTRGEKGRGKLRVEQDLRLFSKGKITSYTFSLYWPNDPDEGDANFRNRVKKLLGDELFREITEKKSNVELD